MIQFPKNHRASRMQQFLYFLPLPQGHGSLRPTLWLRLRIGSFLIAVCWLPAMAASCWPRMLLMVLGAASCVAAPIDHTDSWKL